MCCGFLALLDFTQALPAKTTHTRKLTGLKLIQLGMLVSRLLEVK
jgi:hypothetical protein